MKRIIRGFSSATGYFCLECHHKCCATEYELPLLPQETEILRQKYPFCNIFIHHSVEGSWLLRGDRCPFLNSHGLCILHNTPNKPLICQIYPLIFWKMKPDLILVWINPCRGNGFQWIANPDNRISDQELERLLSKSQLNYKNYLGEQIDKQNPFNNIPMKRLSEEISFFDRIDIHDLRNEIKNLNLVPQSLERFLLQTEDSTIKEMATIINAVIYWLCWSPVGLQLSFNHSKLLFLVAADWVDFVNQEILSQSVLPLNRDQILQQLGSFLATAIIPSFWRQMALKSESEERRKFAKKAFRVLNGEITQEKLDYSNP
ncbi:MAG: YkgJ family cysteine cluster protein [Promethearchaeota archaeon]